MLRQEDIADVIRRADAMEAEVEYTIRVLLKQLGAVDAAHAVHFIGNYPLLNSTEVGGGDPLVNIIDIWHDSERGFRANYREFGGSRVYKDVSLETEDYFYPKSILAFLLDKI